LLHRSIGVAGQGERRGETTVRGKVAGVQDDGLAKKTDGRRSLAGLGEGRGTVAEHAKRSGAVLFLEVHLREPAVAALGARELVDQVLEALLVLAERPLLEAIGSFFDGVLIVVILTGCSSSMC